MTIKTAEKISYEVLIWCINNVGESKYHREFPLIFARYELNKKSRCCGEYDPLYNIIFIYTKLNYTPLQLINTVVHEYIHYLQCPKWIARYMKMYERRDHKNPYENVATRMANELQKYCEPQIRRKIERCLKK
jgi:hypothetical protein